MKPIVLTVILDRSAVIANTGSSGGGVYHAGNDLVLINSTVSGAYGLRRCKMPHG